MRLTTTHLRDAAIIGGAGLTAAIAICVTYRIGFDQSYMPGVISVAVMGLWIFLLGRYGPRPQHPIDPRRQRIWFLSSLGAAGALAVVGMIAALWMGRTYPEPTVPSRDHRRMPFPPTAA
jgi:purine nucleoside phosphorylase